MKSKQFWIVILSLLLILGTGITVQAGEIQGVDIFAFGQSANSVITDMNYNDTNKIYTVEISGSTNESAWLWIVFNSSTLPSNVQSTSEINVTIANTTYWFEGSNQTVNATEYTVSFIFNSMVNINFHFARIIETTPIFLTPIYLTLILILIRRKHQK